MRPCDTVVKSPLPCAYYGSFKMFKISASVHLTLSMHRGMRVSADEFFATITAGVVHGVCKVVTWSSVCVNTVDRMRVEVHGHFATVSQL